MKFVLCILGWFILFILQPFLAVVVLLLLPLLWLLSLLLRLVKMVVEAIFRFLKAILMLPAKLFGG